MYTTCVGVYVGQGHRTKLPLPIKVSHSALRTGSWSGQDDRLVGKCGESLVTPGKLKLVFELRGSGAEVL